MDALEIAESDADLLALDEDDDTFCEDDIFVAMLVASKSRKMLQKNSKTVEHIDCSARHPKQFIGFSHAANTEDAVSDICRELRDSSADDFSPNICIAFATRNYATATAEGGPIIPAILSNAFPWWRNLVHYGVNHLGVVASTAEKRRIDVCGSLIVDGSFKCTLAMAFLQVPGLSARSFFQESVGKKCEFYYNGALPATPRVDGSQSPFKRRILADSQAVLTGHVPSSSSSPGPRTQGSANGVYMSISSLRNEECPYAGIVVLTLREIQRLWCATLCAMLFFDVDNNEGRNCPCDHFERQWQTFRQLQWKTQNRGSSRGMSLRLV